MGLAVEVGMLAELKQCDEEGAAWLRESLDNVNAVLAENNLPPHAEPEELPPLDDRTVIASFPYSFLHYLRRAYAHWKQDPDAPITPCGPDDEPADDPAVEEESNMFESHLLCHSDCEGFYIPVTFTEILIDDEDQGRIEGGLLGSSQQLLQELQAMAPCLDIQLTNGQLPDGEVEKICKDMDSETGLWIERCVWLTLFEAARLSIKHKTAICFG